MASRNKEAGGCRIPNSQFSSEWLSSESEQWFNVRRDRKVSNDFMVADLPGERSPQFLEVLRFCENSAGSLSVEQREGQIRRDFSGLFHFQLRARYVGEAKSGYDHRRNYGGADQLSKFPS